MKTAPARPARFIPTLALLVVAFALATGCGQKQELTLQDNVDFSRVGDIFDAPAGPIVATPPETVLATVQGRPITQGELQRETSLLLMSQRGSIRQEDLAAAAQQLAPAAFQSLVRKALLLDAVEAEAVQVDDALVAERMAGMRQQVPEGQDWDAMLAAQGLTEEQVTEQVALSLRIEKLIQQRTADSTPVSADEIETFFQANVDKFVQPELAGFSHILFRVEPEASEADVKEIRLRAERLQDMIGDQVEFEPLAARFSDDEATKNKGGFVGRVAKAQLAPALQDAVFGSETGEVTLVQSPTGFHLVRVESLEPSRPLTLEEVTPAVSNLIVQQRSKARLEAYLGELSEGAAIEMVGQLPPGTRP